MEKKQTSGTNTTSTKPTSKKATSATKEIKVETETTQEEVAIKTLELAQSKPTWEIKDRFYYLKNGLSPLTFKLRCKNIFWFDEDKGYERELLYTRNQKTVFVDEMVGRKMLDHVVFRNGVLMVPKNMQTLQKLLSIYHPYKDKFYAERDEVAIAEHDMDYLEMEIDALNAARAMDIDQAEAIMRIEVGSAVSKMSSKEVKRDLMLFARRNPALFLELANDDNVELRNKGIKAVEAGIIRLSSDQRTFTWASTGRKLMTVPFDEHPYSALAQWFKTDEGMEVFNSIEKRLV